MRVPVLATDKDTVMHRRDPRAKWITLFLFIAFLYVAPTWEWMLAMTIVGLGVAWLGQTPRKLLTVLWLLQIPNFAALILIPLAADYFSDGALQVGASIEFSLKLGFAWSAALFTSIGLLTTMQVEEMVDGLHGLRFPHVVGFTLGYMFLLMYTSIADVMRISDALRVKGVELETRRPLRLLRAASKLIVPAIFSTVRRANQMMAVLELRGFSPTRRGERSLGLRATPGDFVLVGLAVGVFALALADRLGVVPLTG